MDTDQKYSCTSELGAEVLLVFISFVVAATVLYIIGDGEDATRSRRYTKFTTTWSAKHVSIFLSSSYALFLPLMSYLFSQAQQHNPQGRAKLILVWMVLIEFFRVHSSDSTGELKMSAEQLVRLLWVAFLVYGYTRLDGLKVSLFILLLFSFTYEALKKKLYRKEKDSNLVGSSNSEIIQNYMKRVMLEDNDLSTVPMDRCAYIVMGEENHEITICENGYCLGDRKRNSNGMLTIGRVFQLNTEDEAFTLQNPNWRDFCLSFALAKMLRRRFLNSPLDEAGSPKALQFVLEGLINYIGSNGDNREGNPSERVFQIIQDELIFVLEFSNNEVPTELTFISPKDLINAFGGGLMVVTGIYLIYTIRKKSSTWLSLAGQDAYSHCFFHILRHGTVMVKIFSVLDIAITILLVVACVYNQLKGSSLLRIYLSFFLRIAGFNNDYDSVRQYIKDPAKWNKKYHSSAAKKNVGQAIIHNSTNDTKIETIFCIKADIPKWIRRTFPRELEVDRTIFARLAKWIKRTFSRALPTVFHISTDVKEAVLRSLKNSGGQLTNGETSLKKHGIFEDLSTVYKPSASTTEAIFVWHIATTLFNHQKPPPQQNDDEPFKKEREVALALSGYCYYLVANLPELLPDDVKWTKQLYKKVKKEILDIDHSFIENTTVEKRCNYAMSNDIWDEKSMVENGAKVAKALMDYADNGAQVWTMLSEFWAEMILFISPSDNVKGHEKILKRGELITQLWALLTHAGILTRPKPTQRPSRGTQTDEGLEIAIANHGMETDEGPQIETVIAGHGMEINEGPEIVIVNHGMENNEGPEVVTANRGMENNEVPEITIA